MADSSGDRRVGRIVGDRYRVTERLAAGGMGVVYRAERLQLGRAVAIKFLHPTFAARPEALKRFEVEARAMGRLGHPHTVSVIDFGVDDGVPYVVMDFVHGKTLRELLDAGALPVDRSLKLFRQVLAGVAHAHGQGIIHRDLKPANIILTEATGTGDHVRILDFGLAKLADAGGELSVSQVAVGTPSYMSPEQGRGETVDARSDVYSLGVLLYELLTGEKPFFSDQAFDVIQMHANQRPPTLADKRPEAELSPELEAVVARALQKRPEDRFQTIAEFADALAATPEAAGRAQTPMPAPRARTTVPPVRDAATAESPIEPPRRRGAIWLGLGGLLLGGGLLAVGVWMLSRGPKPPPPQAPIAATPDATPVAALPPTPPPVIVVFDAPPPPPPPPPPDAALPPDAAPPPDAAAPDAAPPPDAALPDAAPLEIVPDEAAEPVAEVAPEPAVQEQEIDTAKQPEPPPPIEVNSVADVERLLRDGQKGEAIAGLERLRAKQPKSAYVPYLLGNLYFERKWWSDGLEAYRDAIRQNRAYRGRAVLVRNAIRALSSKKTFRNATALLVRDIGAPAAPYLRTASKSDPNPTVRARAAALLRQVSRRR